MHNEIDLKLYESQSEFDLFGLNYRSMIKNFCRPEPDLVLRGGVATELGGRLAAGGGRAGRGGGTFGRRSGRGGGRRRLYGRRFFVGGGVTRSWDEVEEGEGGEGKLDSSSISGLASSVCNVTKCRQIYLAKQNKFAQ